MKNEKPEITFGSTAKDHIDVELGEKLYRLWGEMCVNNFRAQTIKRLDSNMKEETPTEEEITAVLKAVKKFQRFKPGKIIFEKTFKKRGKTK